MITAWSWTRYSDYKQCPRKFKYKHVDRMAEKKSPALARGGAVHDAAAEYIKGGKAPMPAELKAFAAEFKFLRAEFKKRPFIVEDDWAFRKDWSQTKWDDWTDCWLRIKLDCARLLPGNALSILDWKTGKHRPQNRQQYTEQLELYALGALVRFPDVDAVHPQLVYLDAEVIYPSDRESLVFKRADVDRLKETWIARTTPLFTDTTHAPNKTVLCGWCSFSKKKGGGPCEF